MLVLKKLMREICALNASFTSSCCEIYGMVPRDGLAGVGGVRVETSWHRGGFAPTATGFYSDPGAS